MNKTQLIDSVAERAGLSKMDSQRAVDAALAVITKALVDNDQINLPGFGILSVKERAERMGRDPRTGNPLKIAASRVVGFKSGKALKDAVNGKDSKD